MNHDMQILQAEAAGTPGDDLAAKIHWQADRSEEMFGFRSATERIAVQALLLDDMFAAEFPEMPNRRRDLQSLAVQMMEIWVGAEKNGEDSPAR